MPFDILAIKGQVGNIDSLIVADLLRFGCERREKDQAKMFTKFANCEQTLRLLKDE